MTVRWKPLFVLSGVFIIVAAVGLTAITLALAPAGSANILAKARAQKEAGRFAEAEIEYKRALALDSTKPEIHGEFADLYEAWMKQAPPDKIETLRAGYWKELNDAAKYGPKLVEPRRKMLSEALRVDDFVDAFRVAKDLLGIEPGNPVAHYVLAFDSLEEVNPNVQEIQKHLEAIRVVKPESIAALWIEARIAEISGKDAALSKALERSRTISAAADAPSEERMSLLRLRVMDAVVAASPDADVSKLSERVEAASKEVGTLTAASDVPPARVARISLSVQQLERALDKAAAAASPEKRALMKSLTDAADKTAEALFRKALDVKQGAELGVYLTYADHLRFRGKREECLEIVEEGLRSPQAARQAGTDAALGLNAIAVEARLAVIGDKDRFEKAEPHIKLLLQSANKRFRALGHLFQGAIDLELANAARNVGESEEAESAERRRFRGEAVGHLRAAAEELPDLPEAQARYGVALILSGETSLGRQYLQRARAKGNLEPQYQLWAAWAMVQGGYPEDAEPIVDGLLAETLSGKRPKDLAGMLHLLKGEIHQARRSPEELRRALAEYDKAFKAGQPRTPASLIRIARIQVLLGHSNEALAIVDGLSAKNLGGPAAEHLAVMTLQEQGKKAEADARLSRAVAKFPNSGELAGLDASLAVRDGRPADADKRLADFLSRNPADATIALLRSQILADALNKPDEAREQLLKVVERGESSTAYVRLAMLDLRRRDFDAVAVDIAKIRAKWRESAAADVLDAQLALSKGDAGAASTFFDAALKKDPTNKVVQFWKARLETRSDPNGAVKVLETLARDGSLKEVDDGLSLMTAAHAALADLALESGDLDEAIARYQSVLKEDSPEALQRGVRRQLVTARLAKKDWAGAKAELQAMLDDPKNPPTLDEIVRASTYYRSNGEDAAAVSLLKRVLDQSPTHASAVVLLSEMLVKENRHQEALALLHKAIAGGSSSKTPPAAALFLMAAAVENVAPPVSEGLKRALAALDAGLKVRPTATELIQAKYQVVSMIESPAAALAFVEAKVAADPKGDVSRLLVNLYRDRRDYAQAEKIAERLVKDSPSDASLAVTRVRLSASRAIEAAGAGDKAAVANLNAKTGKLIAEARKQFPTNATFVQLECELASRQGDFNRAMSLSREVDAIAKTSPVGPLLRARLYLSQNRLREAAQSYQEALTRNPKQPDVRVLLAQVSLRLGDAAEALGQAKTVLDSDPDNAGAILTRARALVARGGAGPQAAASLDEAIKELRSALQRRPRFSDATHLLSDVLKGRGDRAGAVSVLKAGLKAVPEDAAGLSLLVRALTENRGRGEPAPDAEVAEAISIAKSFGEADRTGQSSNALSIGFHRAGRFDLALPWAERASRLLEGNTAVHLSFGDLLLSIAESATDASESRKALDRAVAEYDKVLKVQPNSVEAVNNKAWILHSYMNKSREALTLAQGLIDKVEPSVLPGEFHDTLGAIQESLGQTREAEASYQKGLAKSPDLPLLNYHMGRLLSADGGRSYRALAYLEKAKAGSAQLPPESAKEVAALLARTNR